MSCYSAERLRKFIIHLIYRLCLFILGSRDKSSFLHRNIPYICSVIRHIRNAFRNYILSSIYCILNALDRIVINIACCILLHRLCCILLHDIIRKWFKPFLLSYCCSCSLLLLIRSVKIFDKNHRLCLKYLCLKLISKLSLLLY